MFVFPCFSGVAWFFMHRSSCGKHERNCPVRIAQKQVVAVMARPSATGHVRKTFGHFDAAVAAATWNGLPDGISHPKQLLEPLRRCGSRSPIPREVLSTLELLFDYSAPAAWQDGGCPLVFPGNAELAGCLGVSERTVRNHLSALEKAGLVSIERGPGNRRTPVRATDGSIKVAYGINLSPMAGKFTELCELAADLGNRRKRLKEQKRSAGAALQDVRTAKDALHVLSCEKSDCPSLKEGEAKLQKLLNEAEKAMHLFLQLYNRHSSADAYDQYDMEHKITKLENDILCFAGEANTMTWVYLDALYNENSGQEETHFRHISTNDIKLKKLPTKYVVSSIETPMPHPAFPGFATKQTMNPPSFPASLTSLLRCYCPDLCQTLSSYLLKDPETALSSDWVDAARLVATGMGISEWAWKTGCHQHGRLHATFAVAVAVMKPEKDIYKSRQALLAGMLLRPSGQLNALASFHALRKRDIT